MAGKLRQCFILKKKYLFINAGDFCLGQGEYFVSFGNQCKKFAKRLWLFADESFGEILNRKNKLSRMKKIM